MNRILILFERNEQIHFPLGAVSDTAVFCQQKGVCQANCDRSNELRNCMEASGNELSRLASVNVLAELALTPKFICHNITPMTTTTLKLFETTIKEKVPYSENRRMVAELVWDVWEKESKKKQSDRKRRNFIARCDR